MVSAEEPKFTTSVLKGFLLPDALGRLFSFSISIVFQNGNNFFKKRTDGNLKKLV